MSIRSELKCKVFYFMGFIVFVIYFCCGKIIMFVFIGLVFVFFVVFELFRIIEEWRDRIKYCFLNMYFFFELGRSIEFIENYIEVIIRFYECERVVVYIFCGCFVYSSIFFFDEGGGGCYNCGNFGGCFGCYNWEEFWEI